MPWRTYMVMQHKKLIPQKKWIKTNKAYKPQARGAEKKSLYSKHFGFLDLYNRKEQQNLKCPSGYSVSQCFNMLRLMWHGYHRARIKESDLEGMKKYARKIQDVQKDMGIPTTSFPHIGLYGDVLVLEDKKEKRLIFEDHSALKEKQEKYEKWQAENAKKIQEKLQKPKKEEGEVIEEFSDDVGPSLMDDEETVPEVLEPEEEKGEEIVTMTDDIPWTQKE